MKITGTFDTSCNFACWHCPKQCQMKDLMTTLSDDDFNLTVIESAKTNAGIRITYGWTAQQADQFVKEMSVALFIARQKYLETLQK